MRLSFSNAKKSVNDLCKLYNIYTEFTGKYLSHLLLLAIRIYIGWLFFNSGLEKISNIDNSIILFAYKYNLSLISPEIAVHLSIFVELTFGALVILGFLTKLTALPLAIMTILTQALVLQHEQHNYWLFLLTTLMVFGGGLLSIDEILYKVLAKINNKNK